MIAGDAAITPRLILALLRRLPEGSHYAAAVEPVKLPGSAPTEDAKPDPADERRTWTHDRMLMANLINSVNMLVRHTIPWEEGKGPDFPIVGPVSWREPQEAPKKRVSIMDVLNKITGK